MPLPFDDQFDFVDVDESASVFADLFDFIDYTFVAATGAAVVSIVCRRISNATIACRRACGLTQILCNKAYGVVSISSRPYTATVGCNQSGEQ